MLTFQNGFSALIVVLVVAAIALAGTAGYFYVTQSPQKTITKIQESDLDQKQKINNTPKAEIENDFYGKQNLPNQSEEDITITSPGINEQWQIGKTYLIKWESSCHADVDCGKIGEIRLYRYPYLSLDLAYTIEGVPDRGSYSFTVPESLNLGKYKFSFYPGGRGNEFYIKGENGESYTPDQSATLAWQTYRNDEYGFEFKYSAKDYNGFLSAVISKNDNGVCFGQHCIFVYEAAGESVDDYLRDEFPVRCRTEDMNAAIKANCSYFMFTQKEKMIGNSIKAVELQYRQVNSLRTVFGSYFFNGVKIYRIGYEARSPYYWPQFYDQMLSTFKFTDSKTDKCAEFFKQPTGQNNTIDLPISCELSIGKNFNNWRFSILSGQTSADLPDARFQFEINNDKGEIIQKIPVGDKDYSSNAYEITSTSGDDINFANDINFDGYNDLRVLKFLAASNVIYDYWIFDPSSKIFKKNPILTDVPNPDFNREKREIAAYSASGANPALWATFTYKFINGSYQKIIKK